MRNTIHHRARVLSLVVISLLLCTGLRGQDQPGRAAAAAAAEAKGPEIGPVRIRTMAPVTIAYVATETTFDGLGDAIGAGFPELQKAIEEGKIRSAGAFVLRYPQGSAHKTPDKPFKVEIGLIVAPEAQEHGEVKVRKTEPFKAATVIYTGPPSGMGECYQKLFPAIERMGLVPSGEEREYTTYFESMESPNNIVLVQVGVKERAAGE